MLCLLSLNLWFCAFSLCSSFVAFLSSSTWLSFSSLLIVLKSNKGIPKVSQLGPVSATQHYFSDFFFSNSKFLFLLFNWLSGHSLSSAMHASCSVKQHLCALVMWCGAKEEFAVLLQLPSLTGNNLEWFPESGHYFVSLKILTHPSSHLIPHASCKANRTGGILLCDRKGERWS